jgi:hypothetical protein
MHGTAIQEGEVSQVKNDRLPWDHNFVDLVLEFLDRGEVQLARKHQGSSLTGSHGENVRPRD